MSGMNRTATVALTAAIGLTLLTGCSTSEKSPASSSTAAAAACPAGTQDSELIAAVGDGKLSDGSHVYSSQQVNSTKAPGQIDTIFRICGSTSTGDALKAMATELAAKVQASPLGAKVATMRVTNSSVADNPAAKVRCENFQLYKFGTGAAGTERAPWKTVDQK